MKSLLQLLTEDLNEVSVKHKDVYKDGTQHAIYKDHKDSDKIYKVVKPDHLDSSKQAYDWVKIFKQYPEYLPIVYKSTDRGASVEKLDAEKAKREFYAISDAIKPILGYNALATLLQDVAENESDYKKKVAEAGQYLVENEPELASAFKRFVTLITKLQPINHKSYTLDTHAGNFGYAKNGHLKMLDL